MKMPCSEIVIVERRYQFRLSGGQLRLLAVERGDLPLGQPVQLLLHRQHPLDLAEAAVHG